VKIKYFQDTDTLYIDFVRQKQPKPGIWTKTHSWISIERATSAASLSNTREIAPAFPLSLSGKYLHNKPMEPTPFTAKPLGFPRRGKNTRLGAAHR